MIHDRWPDPDAAVLRHGWRRLRAVLPVFLIALGFGVLGLILALEDGEWRALILLLPGVFPAWICWDRWKERDRLTAIDAHGFWWMRGKEVALVRWDSLAGAGIYWARGSKGAMAYTIELCPKGEIDRDDPLLWELVRSSAPLRPGLPRRRYRVDISGSRRIYEEALRRWVPREIWFGLVEQPWSYQGAPDRAGHRERTREAAARVTPER